MPATISERITGRRATTTTQLYGLEVELERVQDNGDALPGWSRESDGSLRNGIEYVLDNPKSLAQSRTALQRLSAIITSSEPSIRCSFHVHVDVRAWTFEELANVLRCYMVFEDEFFRLSGNRSGSQFCTPIVCSALEGTFRHLIVHGSHPGVHSYVGNIQFERVKYSALNVGHINGLGSIEFRHHEGLRTAADGIAWLDIVSNFCHIAKGVDRTTLRSAIIGADPRDIALLRETLFGIPFQDPVDMYAKLSNFKCTELG